MGKKQRKVDASDKDESNASETDSSLNRVREDASPGNDSVRALTGDSKIVHINIAALDHGVESSLAEIGLVLDTGVNKTLLTEKD